MTPNPLKKKKSAESLNTDQDLVHRTGWLQERGLKVIRTRSCSLGEAMLVREGHYLERVALIGDMAEKGKKEIKEKLRNCRNERKVRQVIHPSKPTSFKRNFGE